MLQVVQVVQVAVLEHAKAVLVDVGVPVQRHRVTCVLVHAQELVQVAVVGVLVAVPEHVLVVVQVDVIAAVVVMAVVLVGAHHVREHA